MTFHHIHTIKFEQSAPDQWQQLYSFLNSKFNQMANELATLQTEVAENKSVMQSAVILLQGLKEKLDAAGTDAAALASLSAELDSNTNALAAAVTANTPSEGSEQPGETQP